MCTHGIMYKYNVSESDCSLENYGCELDQMICFTEMFGCCTEGFRADGLGSCEGMYCCTMIYVLAIMASSRWHIQSGENCLEWFVLGQVESVVWCRLNLS